MNKNQIIIKIENYVKEVMSVVKEESHGFRHVDRVRNWALKIGKIEGEVDLFLLEAAALLHDIGRSKKDDNRNHAAVGAEIAQEFLNSLNCLTKQEITSIVFAIGAHNNPFIQDKMTQILQDADILDGIGAVGIIRGMTHLYNKPHYLNKNSFKINYFTQSEINEIFKKGESGKSVIDALGLTIAIGNNLHTKAAKVFAKAKLAFSELFIGELKKELFN